MTTKINSIFLFFQLYQLISKFNSLQTIQYGPFKSHFHCKTWQSDCVWQQRSSVLLHNSHCPGLHKSFFNTDLHFWPMPVIANGHNNDPLPGDEPFKCRDVFHRVQKFDLNFVLHVVNLKSHQQVGHSQLEYFIFLTLSIDIFKVRNSRIHLTFTTKYSIFALHELEHFWQAQFKRNRNVYIFTAAIDHADLATTLVALEDTSFDLCNGYPFGLLI